MAPPVPTLTPAQFTAHRASAAGNPGPQALLESCPLKQLLQYECVVKQTLPLSGSKSSFQSSTPSSATKDKSGKPARPANLVCTEFVRWFRRCSEIQGGSGQQGLMKQGLGVNVEVTSLMGIQRPKSEFLEEESVRAEEQR